MITKRHRDRVAEVLHQAQADGRISFDEYSERVDRSFAARSRGELSAVTGDLGQRHSPREQRLGSAASRIALRAAWFGWAMVAILSLLIWPVITLLTGDPVSFWPAWITVPWLLILIIWTLVVPRAGRGG